MAVEKNEILNKKEKLMGQKAFLLWFTGLSGSGKTTLGNMVDEILYKKDYVTYNLDGDVMRKGINKDLGFSIEDREKNIERIGYISRILLEAGVIVTATFISPMRSSRAFVRSLIGDDRYVEVFLRCSIEECIKRDPKGLYRKALDDEISEFTGISSPYEEPEDPHITIDTGTLSIKESADMIIAYLEKVSLIGSRRRHG